MKHKKIILIAIMIFAVITSVGYLRLKYLRYNNFIYAMQTLPFELKLAQFYAKFVRLPRDINEYLTFVKLDTDYSQRLNKTGCYLKYDSLKEAIFLYSPGFDGDDDNLQKTYDPNDVDFASSLVKDGDVILQVRTVKDFLFVLNNHFIALRGDQPDSTLKPILQRLFRLSQCYADTVIPVDVRDRYSTPLGTTLEYGEAWFEFRKTNGASTLRLYSGFDPPVIQRVERDLLSEVNKREILGEVDNVIMGFSINFIDEIFCEENYK